MKIIVLLLLSMSAVFAHPHVTVDYAAVVQIIDGKVIGIRHSWSFDALYSGFATQGLGEKKDGKPTEAELADLAKVNLENLDEYGYFTNASLNKVKLAFEKPQDAKMRFDVGQLTLSFLLPLRSPPIIGKENFVLDVFDPSFFVAFQPQQGEFLKVDNAACKADYQAPAKTTSTLSKLGEGFFDNLQSGFAKQFTGSMVVSCR